MSVLIGLIIFVGGAIVGMVLMACIAANGDHEDMELLEEFDINEPKF